MSPPSYSVELRTAAQDSPPKYFLDESGKMRGICVDIIDALMEKEPSLKFVGYDKYLPFKRMLRSLELGELDVFVGLKENEQRKSQYVFLDKPLYEISYVLAQKTHHELAITNLNVLRKLSKYEKVLTVFGSASNRYLQKEGITNVDGSAKSPQKLLNMLMAGRGRVAFYHNLGLNQAIKQAGLESEIRILPAKLSTYSHKIAFSKSVNPEVIDLVEKALESLISSGELTEIQSQYGL